MRIFTARRITGTAGPGAAGGWQPLVLAAALTAILLGIYSPSFRGGFYLDSKAYVRDTHFFQGGISAREAVSRVLAPSFNPAGRRLVPNLTLALQTFREGPRPRPLRVGNVLLHGANMLLAYLLLLAVAELLLPAWSPPRRKWCALLAALLWGFNPFLVDTVAYVVQRAVLMETGFFLAAVLLFLRMGPDRPVQEKLARGAGVLLLLALALASKEVALLFPVVLGAWMGCLPVLRERWRNSAAVPVLLASSVALSVVVLYALKGSQPLVMGLPGDLPFNRPERLLTEARVLLHQASLFVLPLPSRLTLTPFYEISRSLLAPPATLAAVVVLAGGTAAAFVLQRRLALWGAAWVWFLSLHIAESTVWMLHLVFPHRSYLPTVLLPLPFAALALQAGDRLGATGRRAAYAAAAAVVALLCVGTYLRASTWGDEERFWTRAIETAPEADWPYVSLTGYYLEHDRPFEAAALAERAFRSIRRDAAPRKALAPVEANYGIALAQTGRLGQGIAALSRAVALDPTNPDYRYNLAFFLEKGGRREEAKEIYRSLVVKHPTYPDAHLQLALLLIAEGRRSEAVPLVQTELRNFPRNARAGQTLRFLEAAGVVAPQPAAATRGARSRTVAPTPRR